MKSYHKEEFAPHIVVCFTNDEAKAVLAMIHSATVADDHERTVRDRFVRHVTRLLPEAAPTPESETSG